MHKEDIEVVSIAIQKWVDYGFKSKQSIFDSVIKDVPAAKSDASEVYRLLNEAWGSRMAEQANAPVTLYAILRAVFEDLREQNGFVYAINYGDCTYCAVTGITEYATEQGAEGFIVISEEAILEAVEGQGLRIRFGIPEDFEPTVSSLNKLKKTIITALNQRGVEANDNGDFILIPEVWSKRLVTPFLSSIDSEWRKVNWKKVGPESRVTRVGGLPTPIYGENLYPHYEEGWPLFFYGQVVLPDGRLAQVYTDPDAVGNGDWGNYEDSYEEMVSDTPHYQRRQPDDLDGVYDLVLIEGEPLPEDVSLLPLDPEMREAILLDSEDAYSADSFPSEPSWLGYEDTPEDDPHFLFQIPNESHGTEMFSWTWAVAYVFWNGKNHARIIWHNTTDVETVDEFKKELKGALPAH